MSIRTFNKFMNSGCVLVAAIIMAAFFLISSLQLGRSGGPNQQGDAQALVVAKAGPASVTEDAIQTQYQSFISNQPAGARPSPDESLQAYGQILDKLFEPGLAALEAQRQGVVISDDDAIKQITTDLDTYAIQEQFALIERKELPPTATQADLDKYLVAHNQKTIEQTKADAITQIKAALADKTKRASVIAGVSPEIVPGKMAEMMKPSVDQLKASYVTLSAKRILLTGPNASQEVATIQAALKSGQSFESMIDKYSTDVTNNGKKASDTVLSITHDQLVQAPMSDLLKVSPGQVSAPLTLPQGTAIYKILAAKPALPKDFDKNQAQLLKDYATSQANAKYTADIAELKKSGGIAWESKTWKALWDVYLQLSDATGSMDQKKTQWQALVSEAHDTLFNGKTNGSTDPAVLARFVAINQLANLSTPAEKAAMLSDQIDATNAVINIAPTTAVAMQLADLGAHAKQMNLIVSALQNAIQFNNDYTKAGTATIKSIQARAVAYQKQGLLNADAVKAVNDAVASWNKDQVTAEQEIAQHKAAQAALDKQQAEEKKQFEAAQAAQAKKNKGAPSVGSVQTPSPSQKAPAATGADQPPISVTTAGSGSTAQTSGH